MKEGAVAARWPPFKEVKHEYPHGLFQTNIIIRTKNSRAWFQLQKHKFATYTHTHLYLLKILNADVYYEVIIYFKYKN